LPPVNRPHLGIVGHNLGKKSKKQRKRTLAEA